MRNLLSAIVVATVMASPVYAKTTTRDSATPTAESPLSNGREVAAPPWSFACMTDHGPSPCGEPMWVYH